jgi:ribosome biogenesis GTPase
VIVLTKKDVCLDLEEKLLELEHVSLSVDILITSSKELQTLEMFSKYVTTGKTSVFVGSSGVGKSTLINLLVGKELLKTKEIRKDDKGKHASTNRQLIILPKGGIVIDTPGLREIQIETGDVGHTFYDIEELATKCKFKDCSHDKEPGCAVKVAIKSGALDPKRLANYQKLSRETEYQALSSREIENKKIENMVGSKTAYKKIMKEIRQKNDKY